MTDILPPRSFSFDYYSSPEVKWSDGQRTFAREYPFNAQNVIRAAAGIPSPILLDLIEVAFAAYFSDRLARRRDARDRGRGVQWRRHLALRVGVRDVSLWKQADVQASLSACLNFLTEDKWEFDFLPRRAAPWDVEQQSILIAPPPQHKEPNNARSTAVPRSASFGSSSSGSASCAQPHPGGGG